MKAPLPHGFGFVTTVFFQNFSITFRFNVFNFILSTVRDVKLLESNFFEEKFVINMTNKELN